MNSILVQDPGAKGLSGIGGTLLRGARRRRSGPRVGPSALAGRVPTKVDARYGPIRAGDRLTSSPTPGHAMKQIEAGMSVGVAREDFAGPGAGSIMILVQPGWHGGAAGANPTGGEIAELRSELEAVRALVRQLQARLDDAAE
jgi:hypothetical protein